MINLINLVRIHQWVKNFLIFVPLVASNIYSIELIIQAVIAFFLFSFLASGTYIINDIKDFNFDKKHPTKKKRPIASKKISIFQAKLISIALIATSIFFSYYILNLNFFILLLVYFLLTIIYTYKIKHIKFVDIIVLSSFYIIRIYAGAEATGIGYFSSADFSPWLLTLSSFIFLAFASLKRLNEIKKYNLKINLYSKNDFSFLHHISMILSYLSIFVLVFYFKSEQITEIYASPEILWFIFPIFFYWITKLNYKAFSGKMDDDPIIYVCRSSENIISLALIFLIVIISANYQL